jgi:hypothetical protein
MKVAEDKAVAARRGRPARVEAQNGEEQRRQDVRRRKVAADVAKAGAADHLHDAAADLGGRPLQARCALGGAHRRWQGRPQIGDVLHACHLRNQSILPKNNYSLLH